jgi:hypothetical protein
MGPVRSGTSLTAGILNAIGVSMDHDPYWFSFRAPNGFYESTRANAINSKILWARGLEEFSLKTVEHVEDKPDLKEEIKDFLSKRPSLWGFKDPKLCLTIECYIPFLQNPYFVITDREASDSAKSWRMHGWLRKDFEEVIKIVNFYKAACRSFINKHLQYPIKVVEYAQMHEDPIGVAKSLCNFCEILETQQAFDKVKDFVIPRYTTIS